VVPRRTRVVGLAVNASPTAKTASSSEATEPRSASSSSANHRPQARLDTGTLPLSERTRLDLPAPAAYDGNGRAEPALLVKIVRLSLHVWCRFNPPTSNSCAGVT
jgi:hypothetical protein